MCGCCRRVISIGAVASKGIHGGVGAEKRETTAVSKRNKANTAREYFRLFSNLMVVS
jgi:hypothetical protein